MTEELKKEKNVVSISRCLVWGTSLSVVYLITYFFCGIFWTHEYGIPWMIVIVVSYPAVLLYEPLETLLAQHGHGAMMLPEWLFFPLVSSLVYFVIGFGGRWLLMAAARYRCKKRNDS